MDWDYGVVLDRTAVALPPLSPFVAGSFVDGTGDRATVWDPSADAALAEVRTAGPADVERAVAAAGQAQPGWAALPGARRSRLLWRLAREVATRAAELAALETAGTGRPVRAARDDVAAAIAHLRSCAGWADKLEHAGLGPVVEPVGVLGAPVGGGPLAAVRRVGPTLACGNALLLRPDGDAPLAALALAEIVEAIGLPAGVLAVLPGAEPAGVDRVLPADAPGRGVHVVHDDAPLDQAVDGIVEALGTDRPVLVAEAVADEFGALLCERVARLRVGDPRDVNTDVGPVATRERRDRAAALLAAGDDAGARRFTSPAALPERGLYLAPTVFTDVAPATALARDPITGPVLPVLTFRTPVEAVALAGRVRTAAVWTDKGSRGLWTAEQLRADVVWVNAVDRPDTALPGGALAAYVR